MSGGYSGKFLQIKCEIQLPRDNLGDWKVLERAFFRLLKSLKYQSLESIVPPPGCTGFITNLPFWATWRLERMHSVTKVYVFIFFFCKIDKKMFRTASSFEPYCLWIVSSLCRQDGSIPDHVDSIVSYFLVPFTRAQLKAFPNFWK